jgi:RNA polymerase sigma-70 factor (ECF subfamily)
MYAMALTRPPPATLPDDSLLLELMIRYQEADLRAAEELIQRLSPLLLRFLSGPCYTRCHTADLLQDCWLQIHLARHTFRTDSPLLPWIFSIARHVRCRGFHRQLRIWSREIGVNTLPERINRPSPVSGTFGEDLIRALDLLPKSQRQVIFLQKVCGMSVDEVANNTSCSAGAVKQKAYRAYQTLRRIYSRHRPEKK